MFPRFMRQNIPSLRLGSDSNVLTYFPETEENGVNIKWARECNTVDMLERALYSSKTLNFILTAHHEHSQNLYSSYSLHGMVKTKRMHYSLRIWTHLKSKTSPQSSRSSGSCVP